MTIWSAIFQLRFLLATVFMLQLLSSEVIASRHRSLLNNIESWSKKAKDDSTRWAVLVAGSKGYYNYRHQADICHAYQLLIRGGLKDENIIVFMYDDIAHDPKNPRPGVIINNPKGSDVYAGVPKDYTGEAVTAANFYAVLLGNASGVTGGSKKVVASKPQDKIFLFYSDHGGPGVLGMPKAPAIYAIDFIQVLQAKHAMGTYDEMVIYLESCESGSMFEGILPKDLNIYVTTASQPFENSWATYCPGMKPASSSSPPHFDTCLADLYSVSWMEDSESEDLRVETLEQQYLKVKIRTLNKGSVVGSHVMQYGTLRISNETVSVFQGSNSSGKFSTNPYDSAMGMGVVNQRDADLYSMWHRYKKLTEDSQEKEQLFKEIKEITAHRAHLDKSVDMIKSRLLGDKQVRVRDQGSALVDDWGCLKFMVRTFETYCGSLTQYGLKHTRTFANLCNNGVTNKAMDEATKETCSKYKTGQWNPEIVGYSA